jgi:HK97 gp10 family phage protein
MELKVSFEGLKELEQAFDLLPRRVGVKAASKAVREGAKIIQKAARANVPVDTGNLRRSISVKVLNKRRDALEVAAIIGPATGYVSKRGKNAGKKVGDGFYGFFVEYGTKDTKAQPFMRPAYDENVQAAQQAIVDVIGEAIEREAQAFYRGP